MATAQDAISRLQIETTSDGTDAATDSLNKLAEAYGGVTVASTGVEKTTSSLDSKFASIERRYNDQVKALQDYQKVQNTVNAAVSQNPALQDRANTVLAAAKQRYDDLTGTQSVFQKGLDAAGEKASELTHELGPLGTVLTTIGPLGIAIGAGLGIASLALEKLKEQADEAGRWAAELQNAANTIGLNTSQLQALNEAAATVGVSANDNISAFERFSASLGQLRDGSGSLYTQLLKVNPALVNQLSVTRDAATGWNLLAQAYAQADKQQQALIARAAFGRSGSAEGGVLLATANAGGVGGLQAQNEDAISQDQIKRWADLTTQINSATEAAQHNFQSIFTTTILENQKAFAENLLNISRYAKDFTLSDDLKSYLAKLGSGALSLAGNLPVVGPIVQGVQAAAGLASDLTTSGYIPAPAAPAFKPSGRDFDSTFGAVANSNSATAAGQTAASLGVQAAQASAAVSFLGSAATATDRYNASVAKLNVEVANNSNLTGLQGRAMAGLNLDRAISEQNSYVGALGEFATTQDRATQASLNFQKAQLTNSRLTNDQRAAVVALTAANDDWARANNQAQIGVFNLAAAEKAASDQFKAQQAPGGYLDHATPEQLAAAYQAYANKVSALGDAAKVAGSAFPQLTQLGLDAGNLNKQLDAFATTSLNAVSPALQDMLNGTTSLSAGFQNLGLTVVKALENMIIQMTIIKPLASSLSGLFGLGGAGPITLGTSAGPTPFVPSAKGNMFDGGNVVPFANGGAFTNSIVDSPTLFKFASGTGLMGEAGPEAIVPLKRGSDGSLGIVSTGGGGGTSISFGDINITFPPGTDTTDASNIAAAVKPMIAQVVDERIRYHTRQRGMLNSAA